MRHAEDRRQPAELELLRFATAGSVDDGKSTLIGRLLCDTQSIYEDQLEAVAAASRRLNRDAVDLALVTDGLRAEREQGITIDVAYRSFATAKRRFIIADAPGHEQYTRNMVTAASTANLVVILIDAVNGVLTQSKRHMFLASLLAVPHFVVAVNKMDLVGFSRERFLEIREALEDFAVRLNIPDIIYLPISALHGDNVTAASQRMPWYEGPHLLAHLENVHIGGDRNLVDFRFPVQYVNRPRLDFRGFCGSIASGVVRRDEEVMALPSGQTTRVRSIVAWEGEREYAVVPQAVTLLLANEIDLSRGDMLVHPRNLPQARRECEAMLVWMHSEPMRPGKPYLIKHATRLVRGRFTEIVYRVNPNDLHRHNADRLQLNEIGRVALETYQPLLCDEYRRNRATGAFIVIDLLTNATVGAGLIIERGAAGQRTAAAEPVSRHISRHGGDIGPAERARLLGQKPVTLWFTGLSSAGKSTLAFALEKRLVDNGHACYVLDGDNLRYGLCRDLGFSANDRAENIRRAAEVARLMNDAGLIVIAAFISPYRQDRQRAREIIGGERFIEVYLDTPIEICEKRDTKGLYRKARAGEIVNFTGVSAPYEPPENPDIHLQGGSLALDAMVAILFQRATGEICR